MTAAMTPVSTPDTVPSIRPASSRMSGVFPVALAASASSLAGTRPGGLLAEPTYWT
jgi:methylglyoxal synthase